MTDERAKLLSSLRASTITLLGYDDVEHLTAAQQIRIDRAITLRLTIDDLQARQLRGERIDVSGFVEASESLERMVGGNPLEASVLTIARGYVS
jgi:voltage-gated potassium channel Kch